MGQQGEQVEKESWFQGGPGLGTAPPASTLVLFLQRNLVPPRKPGPGFLHRAEYIGSSYLQDYSLQ